VDLRIGYLDEHIGAIPTLAQWHHAEWFALTPHLSLADRIEEFTARARRGSIPTGFVALIDNRVVGMACLVECDIDSHCHLTPWLATVLVSPEHRHRGVGSALCVRAAHEARRLGVSSLYLFTFDKQSLYTRLDWSALEGATYAGRPGTVMVRRLAL
jgi:N-acetylglutamate synthase-like GNAT family acetyltransferase